VFSVTDARKLLIYAGSGPGGRWFESTRPDQIFQTLPDILTTAAGPKQGPFLDPTLTRMLL
jgi:hypothetical protein